jgi:ABC-type transport system involved in multi-copper enzyme maturation permease subunit
MISQFWTLIRTDVLKLRRRRGLMAIALLIGVGAVSIVFVVNAIRHGANPQTVGPAGGIRHFQDATDFLGLVAVVVAAMIGVTAGAGEAELGVLRDVVATGRPRVTLFASRAVAATIVTVVIMAAAMAMVTVLSLVFAGSAPSPSLSQIVARFGAVLAFAAAAALVCTGVGTLARSRGPVMATVIALGVVVSQLLLRATFLGGLRNALPLAAFQRLADDPVSGLKTSLAVAIGVTVLWAVAALAAGGWWARRVEV